MPVKTSKNTAINKATTFVLNKKFGRLYAKLFENENFFFNFEPQYDE